MPVMSALGRLREEECHEFRTSLNYVVRPCFQILPAKTSKPFTVYFAPAGCVDLALSLGIVPIPSGFRASADSSSGSFPALSCHFRASALGQMGRQEQASWASGLGTETLSTGYDAAVALALLPSAPCTPLPIWLCWGSVVCTAGVPHLVGLIH